MSGAKFASLTAGLLVRKGEATPSPIVSPAFSLPRPPERLIAPERAIPFCAHDATPPAAQARPSAPEKKDPPKPVSIAPPGEPPPPVQPEKPRRLMVTLSPNEFETLGLIAVKKGATRHQLLRNALEEYMALLVEEYDDCQCIYTGCYCGKAS